MDKVNNTLNNTQEIIQANKEVDKIYYRLRDSITDERGFGGPVAHEALIDGWNLRISSSDFGDLILTVKKDDQVIGFQYWEDNWQPLTIGTENKDIILVANLFKKAQWKDMLDRSH